MKRCFRCEQDKPLSDFGKGGKQSYCSPCRSEYHKEWRNKNAELVKERQRQWRLDNPDRARASAAKWRSENPERYREITRRSMRKRAATLRQQALDRYGRGCACCGESIEVFLCLDHIDGGGNEERRQHTNGTAGWVFYRWLESQGWPDGYQTLCHNCNIAKHRLGVCPHQD